MLLWNIVGVRHIVHGCHNRVTTLLEYLKWASSLGHISKGVITMPMLSLFLSAARQTMGCGCHSRFQLRATICRSMKDAVAVLIIVMKVVY